MISTRGLHGNRIYASEFTFLENSCEFMTRRTISNAYVNTPTREEDVRARPSSASELGSFGMRLKDAIGDQSIRSVATGAGLSEGSVRQYVAGKNEPTRPAIINLSRTLGVEIRWLSTGEGPMRMGAVAAEGPAVDYGGRRAEDEYVSLPRWKGAAEADPQGAPWVHFRREWLAGELRATPDELHLLYIEGDSMEPTLREGDAVLLRRGRELRDGVYALRLGDAVLVKRLQFLADGLFRATSDNPAYQPFEARLTAPETEIIGRVVWAGKRM